MYLTVKLNIYHKQFQLKRRLKPQIDFIISYVTISPCVCVRADVWWASDTSHLVGPEGTWQSQEKISLYQYEEACVQEVVCVLPMSLCGVL